MKIPSAPHKVTLNITNRCNLECLYCGVSSSKNAPGDMRLEAWKKVINELAGLKVFNLVISGGEPFARPDFFDILKHILRYHFRVSINTNGTLLNDNVLSLVSESNRFDNIQVSLDGHNSAIHDFIRGQGTFQNTINGLKMLQRWNIPFRLFIVVNRNNKDYLEEIVGFSKHIAAAKVILSPLVPQGSALSHLDDLFLTLKEHQKVASKLRRLKEKYPKFIGGSFMQIIEENDRILKIPLDKKKPVNTNKITSCGGSVTECAIRPDGGVIPCDRLWDYIVGNVEQQSFKSIWLNSTELRKFRKRFSRYMDSFEECKGCRFVDECKGGCPAIPYNMGKGVDGWDPLSCFLVYMGKKKSYV